MSSQEVENLFPCKRKEKRSKKITFGYIHKITDKITFFCVGHIPLEIINIIYLFYHEPEKGTVIIKIGMLGDPKVGKELLKIKFTEERYDEDYPSTLGVNFMESTIEFKNVKATLQIWNSNSPMFFTLICSNAKIILFCFDLMKKDTLFSVKQYYKDSRKENQTFMPFLIGTKFDLYDAMHVNYKNDITKQARKFAKKMYAPLIYCSSAESINVKRIFKLAIARMFDLKPKMTEKTDHQSQALCEWTPYILKWTAMTEQRYNTKKKENKSKKKKSKKKRTRANNDAQ